MDGIRVILVFTIKYSSIIGGKMCIRDRPRRPEGNSRFWHGVLAGALVTVFAGLIVVGMSLGIYLFSRSMGRGGSRPEASQTGPGITDGKETAGNELDYEQINTKMSLIQNIIDRYFLYDEDMENVEDYIYKGCLLYTSIPGLLF